jgi:beta-lactamase superfamily II metal-dependent hydrolase
MDEKGKEQIKIHVLNAWAGDSILIEFGDGVWGVVDSNRQSKDAPIPALEFLKKEKQRGNFNKIIFVALTHPHLDHFRGMPEIFAHFKEQINEFWDFGRDARPIIAFFLRWLRGEGYQSGLSLLRFYEAIYTLKKEGSIRHLSMGSFQLMYRKPKAKVREVNALAPQMTIWALSPSRNDLDRYFESIEFRKEDQEIVKKMRKLDQNDVSAVLLINFYEHFILLGSDAKAECWAQILIDPRLAALRESNREDYLKSHIVKVSHHGSKYSQTENLWQSISIPSVTVAAISAEGKVNPHQKTVKEILKNGVELYCTNRPHISIRGLEDIIDLMPQTIAAWEEWNVHLDAQPEDIADSYITISIDASGFIDTSASRNVVRIIDEENAIFLT